MNYLLAAQSCYAGDAELRPQKQRNNKDNAVLNTDHITMFSLC